MELEIGGATTIAKLQCGCCDCRQVVEWPLYLGGPKSSFIKPLDIWYFGIDNYVVLVQTNQIFINCMKWINTLS